LPAAGNKTGIVVLAAGISSRFGSPKQLLSFNGKTLLKHSVSEAINSDAGCVVVVVVGANKELILPEIDETKVAVIENKEWQEGMASSLRTGLIRFLEIIPQAEAVIFMVCDQPFVDVSVLNAIIKKHAETGKRVVASNYGEIIGTPALFHTSLFKELMLLKGDIGARNIIQKYTGEMETIVFPMGSKDIDRKGDYEELLKH
jgi:molybdenum cofactor cytidylyltransferase